MLTSLSVERLFVRRRDRSAVPAAAPRALAVPELTRLGFSELERISALTRGSMLIPAGTYLVQHGHPFYDLYAVRSGCIRASITNGAGYLRVIKEYRAGEIIGLDALRRGNYLADFLALEISTVCPLPLYMLGDLAERQALSRRSLQ